MKESRCACEDNQNLRKDEKIHESLDVHAIIPVASLRPLKEASDSRLQPICGTGAEIVEKAPGSEAGAAERKGGALLVKCENPQQGTGGAEREERKDNGERKSGKGVHTLRDRVRAEESGLTQHELELRRKRRLAASQHLSPEEERRCAAARIPSLFCSAYGGAEGQRRGPQPL